MPVKMLCARRRAFAVRTSSFPKESVNFHWKDYAGSTSIHGVKYVAEPRRPVIERLWWILVLGGCLTGNVMLIRKMWHKYDETQPFPVTVNEIPFPALTICNEMKSKKSFFDKLNQTEEGSEQLGLLDIVISLTDIDYGEYQSLNMSGLLYFNRTDVADFLTRATPTVDEMMESCEYGTNKLSKEHIPELMINSTCSSMFSKVFTDAGVCYTFNALPAKELFQSDANHCNQDHGRHSSWSAQNGYNEDDFNGELSPPIYPYRTFSGRKLFGISLELKTLRSDVMLSRYGATMAGFKVLLHSPENFPLVGDTSILVPPNNLVTTMVVPKVTKTAEGLESYRPEKRGCYYQHEMPLKFFKVYTFENCMFECLVNLTYDGCNCVAFHMPKNETMEVCHHSYMTCIIFTEVALNWKGSSGNCKCLPSCFSVEYDSKTRQSEYRSKTWNKLNQSGYDVSKLEVFFEKSVFQPYVRREVVDLVDFLASCGGLLGLFSGMSIISFGEIVYYLTFRLWSNVHYVKKSSFAEKQPSQAIQTISGENTGNVKLDPPMTISTERNHTVKTNLTHLDTQKRI